MRIWGTRWPCSTVALSWFTGEHVCGLIPILHSKLVLCSASLTHCLIVIYMYCNLPSKRPWALEIHGQKTGVGVYTEKLFVHIHTDRRIIKQRGWALTRRWALTRENTVHTCKFLLPNLWRNHDAFVHHWLVKG